MYSLDWIGRMRTKGEPLLRPPSAIHPTVWRLGLTSLLTDLSSEMVASILPTYFVLYLRFTPLQFGLLDGLSQGAAIALLSLAAGIAADRWRQEKRVAVLGYGASAACKVALLALGGAWKWVAAVLIADRAGKAIRTAPRDAMISLVTPSQRLATAFAVHRAMDAAGAVAGPLVAFVLLSLVPGGFDVVFLVSFCVALSGLGVIGLLVDSPRAPRATGHAERLKLSGLLTVPRFRTLVLAGGLLGVATASDGFIYLLLQRGTAAPATVIPLFAFLTALTYLVCSIPVGRLADRYGRGTMFLLGHVPLLAIHAILFTSTFSRGTSFLAVALLGFYYSATDGVLTAMASAVLGADLRASGLALLGTVVSIGRLVSSVVFGWLWTASGAQRAVSVFAMALTAALLAAVVLFRPRRVS